MEGPSETAVWESQIKDTPSGRTIKIIHFIGEDPPSYLQKYFENKQDLTGMTEQQVKNHAIFTADEWFIEEINIRKNANSTPIKYKKEFLQKDGYEKIISVVAPFLDNQEFMNLIAKRLTRRYQDMDPELKKLFEVEFLTPADPIELWKPRDQIPA